MDNQLPITLPDASDSESIWTHDLAFPLYAAALSVLVLLLRAFRRTAEKSTPDLSWKDSKKYGGLVVLAYNIVRFLACLTLVELSTASLVIHGAKLDTAVWGIHLGLAGFYVYASLLAAAAIVPTSKFGPVAKGHLDLILLVAFGVYSYRDIFPLATYSWPVQDAAEGRILRVKLIVLTVAAVVVPLLTPRTYVPVDPLNPMPVPNAEQTASPLSLLFFNYLDSVVYQAYKLPHLPYDLLPPLADTDHSENLKARGFPNLDPFRGAGRRHIFFGLMKTFRSEYLTIVCILTVYVACTFASPIGINRVLAYLEDGTSSSEFRPFLWIMWLALGPLAGTTATQAYFSIAKRILVQVEGLLTELIFEHALRVRVKAQNPDGNPAPSDAESSEGTLNVGDAQSDASSETVQGTQSTTSKDAKSSGSSAATSSVDVGRIMNLVSTDLRNVTEMSDFLMLLFYLPASVIFSVIFLYVVLGWSAFVGMATMVILFPLSGIASQFLQDIQKGRIKAADARIGTITETMNVLRMIKLFGWEEKMLNRVNEKREAELHWIWKREIFEWVANTVNSTIPIITMMVTYISFTVLMKQELRPSIVFSTLPVFDILRNQLHMANYRLIQFIDAKVSIDRINDFLHNTELLDTFAESEETAEFLAEETPAESEMIGFRDASFTWSNDSDGTVTPSRRKFVLRIDEELLFKRGCINLVLGPTGAGKTSLLMALLGEMHFIPSTPNSWFNLPRAGGVAYASQESWVLNETIRDNILFGAEYEEERYKKVIHQCALERDLELFDAGDASEVGEKGLTLSGGQKARITLARAIYNKAAIVLLDDVLAALGVHTSKWIVEKCFSGDLVRGRTIILVTHNVALAAPVADFTVSIGLNGEILSQGSVADALQHDIALAEEANAELEVLEQVVDPAPTEEKKDVKDGKLILAEEVKLGRVKWSAVGLYLRGLGGFGFYTIFLGFYTLSQMGQIFGTWYLGYFASLYETSPSGSVSVAYHMQIYGLITVFDILTRSIGDVTFAYAVLRASRSIHRALIKSILGTTLRWLDTTPTSRVIARFTADITAVDGPILNVFAGFVFVTISILLSFGAVVLLTPIFSIPGVGAGIIGGILGQLFIKAQLSVKREASNAKAPVLGHFSAAIAGLPSIRAYGAQGSFISESLRRINKYTRAARTLNNLDRWVGVRLAVVGNFLAAFLAIYLVYYQQERSNTVGFSLSLSAGFSMRILFWVRIWNDTQIQGNSLERIQQYIDIEQEPKPSEAGKPPAHWPTSGQLIVEKLSARYSPDGPKVLREISFNVNAGERVGIVGRTGSGKSSLTLALLRSIYTEGTVYYDGIATSSINLDALRSNITIIPQMPELLSGSLRHNLDPFGQYDDLTLNNALRAAGLFSLQEEMDEGRLVLDSIISSGGSNLSVGQRQILALARAIVRDSKVLILDEATSAIDYKTDTVIQASLRHELKSDVTVLTVAHRLQTILDSDKIASALFMVLDEGRIVEFDAPKVLLQNPKGKLRALVDESGDKEQLYAMAEGKGQ
ncbi:P-loop containing nucleoside triphosphate hydrolase protein [Roridomyces roridus]|uniref:P-loop containing nucleoside triphosphate hydrolase protein n=1 Tax=Roridomyces roridus TaxID=1738132 RepID=A0AAD7BZ23_9AGAR|nr:P-loop containing nucleoside triphosphate hydrolase protein [Roridomyces roridus]